MDILRQGIFTDREQIEKAIYGKIIVTALIVAMESQTETAIDAFISLVFATSTLLFAHFYASMLALDIAEKKTGNLRESIALLKGVFPLALGVNGPAFIFLLSFCGLFSVELAFLLAKLTAILGLFIYGFLLGRAIGKSVPANIIIGLVTAALGIFVILVKVISH